MLIADLGFDPSLIPQMLISLQAHSPKVILVMTTPVAQVAKVKIPTLPLVYTVATDPVESGLLRHLQESLHNMVGSSEKQDLDAFLAFATQLLLRARRIGILYATSQSNDKALVRMMSQAASRLNMEVIAIPVDQARDVAMRVHQFKNKVDFIRGHQWPHTTHLASRCSGR
jgi:putative ABC transport system substrate-binding protein